MSKDSDFFSVEDKVVIVTGGTGSYGFYFCQGLAEAGATVITTSRDKQRVFSKIIMVGISFFILSQMICTGALCASQVPSERLLHVGSTSTPPVIDGALNDKCWSNATMASGFISVDGQWAHKQTTVYVTYDNTYLYIAFECNESTPEKIKKTAIKNDDLKIFGGETVELFLDTNHDHQTYYHIGINPWAAQYEAACSIGEKEVFRKSNWNPDWELKTRIGDNRWVAEMRIPLTSFGSDSPASGAVWGINFARSNRTGKSGFASWAAVQEGFNRPDKFGKIIFGSPADVSYSMSSFSTGSSARQNQPGSRIRFRNGKNTPLTVRAQSAWGGVASSIVLSLAPKEEKEIFIPHNIIGDKRDDIPLKYIGQEELSLTVSNAKTEEIYDSQKGMLIKQETERSLTIDRYYYTPDVEKMQIAFTNKTKTDSCFKVEIKKDANGKVLASKQISVSPDKNDYVISFDIKDWDLGRYVVSANLTSEAGENLFSMRRVFFKVKETSAKIPSATPKISLRADGTILLDEKPFCPFLAHAPISPLTKDCFNVEYGERGLTSRPLTRRDIHLPPTIKAYDKKGDTIVFTPLPEEKKLFEDIRKVINADKADPLLLYWFMSYEAQLPMVRGREPKVFLNNPQELRKISQFIKSIDPNHLTAIEIDHSDEEPYKDSADVIEVARWSSTYAHNLIPNLIKDIGEIKGALGPGKPFLLWLGSSIPTPEARIAEEIRCASYLSLMHGAAGLVFHMGHGGMPLSDTRHWSVYAGLSREVEELFSILRAPQDSKSKIDITVDSDSIDYCVRQRDGRLYLIAVNTSYSSVNTTFSIKSYTVPKEIKLLFENREIKSDGNSFSDEFTGLEPHIYELSPAKRNRSTNE
jgi:hypothetical protein